MAALPLPFLSLNSRRTADATASLRRILKEVEQSKEFESTIDEQFKGFSKPRWMTGK
jgi:D-methionine transport system substrate-binding protein